MLYTADIAQADQVNLIEDESGSQLILKTVEIENMDNWSSDMSFEQEERKSDYVKGSTVKEGNLKD